MLLAAILRGIDDDTPLASNILIASPLRDLVQAYNKKALIESALPAITGDSTGADLKMAIGNMRAEDQVELLQKYSAATKTLDAPMVYSEDPKVTDERRLRHWMMKTFILLTGVLVCIIIGVTVAVMVHNKMFPPASVITTIINSATEIIKLIFSLK